MREWLRGLLFSPDDTDPSYLRLLRTILVVASLGVAAITLVLLIQQGLASSILILVAILFLMLVSLFFSLRNILWPGKLLIPLSLVAGITYIASSAWGLHDSSVIGYAAVIVVTSLLIGRQAIPLITTLTVLGTILLGILDMSATSPSIMAERTGIDDIVVISMVQIIIAASLNALMSRLFAALQKSEETAQAQIASNQELRELQVSLEERIEERTMTLEHRSIELSDRTVQLEISNIRTQKRAAQLRTISEVSKAISSVRSLQELLPRITQVVSEQFGFYHVGIFLTDDASQFAILSAANSEGGQKMLARGHRLAVGAQGVVGYVTSAGMPRIVLDTGSDTVFFNNPDLPETHSEVAVPLRTNKRIIGALDIQSNQVNAFSQEDLEAFSILADQITIAIENSRLFETTQKSITEAETLYRNFLRQEWKARDDQAVVGFSYSASGAAPLTERVREASITQVSASGEVLSETGENAFVTIPIKLREEVIGALKVNLPGKRIWKSDEIGIVQAVADRIAISAENARLFEESQQRAAKEQIIGQISAKIGTSTNLDNIFYTLMEELGQVLPGSEIVVQFENQDTQPSTASK